MTHRQFLNRLAALAAAAALLAAGLRLGLGASWFSFYGWAIVALAAVPALTVLLWKRLPARGRSHWWSLVLGFPVSLAALIQIAFWASFFSQGPRNPMLGVVREMLRPWIDAGQPIALAAVLVLAVWLIVTAARPTDRS